MSLFDWFRSRSRAVVCIGESSLEVEGDAEFVERYLDRFLAEQRLASRAQAAALIEERREEQTRLAAAAAARDAQARVEAAQLAELRPTTLRHAPPPAPAPVATHPPVTSTRSGRGRPWRARGEFVRIHSIDADIAKVYSIESRRLRKSTLTRALDLSHLTNVYVEGALLVRNLKGDQQTLWHRLMPKEAAGESIGESVAEFLSEASVRRVPEARKELRIETPIELPAEEHTAPGFSTSGGGTTPVEITERSSRSGHTLIIDRRVVN